MTRDTFLAGEMKEGRAGCKRAETPSAAVCRCRVPKGFQEKALPPGCTFWSCGLDHTIRVGQKKLHSSVDMELAKRVGQLGLFTFWCLEANSHHHTSAALGHTGAEPSRGQD